MDSRLLIKLILARRRRILKHYKTKQAKNRLKECGVIGPGLDKFEKEELKSFWTTRYGTATNDLWHAAFKNLLGVWDVRFIPHDVWWTDILPAFNDFDYYPAYLDKNMSDILIDSSGVVKTPETIIRRIDGNYYDQEYNPINRNAAQDKLFASCECLIAKSSILDDGAGVVKLNHEQGKLLIDGNDVSLEALEYLFNGDFLVQNFIKQCLEMAQFHPNSVNTIRTVTMRWKGRVIHLLSFARFGSGGRVTDNAGSGGLCCGISDNGHLHDYAVNEKLQFFTMHPDSGYQFNRRMTIPNFQKVVNKALQLHERIHHFDLVSWDFAINTEHEPVFIEMNFRGASWIYQFACGKPIFGDLSEEVLTYVKHSAKWKKFWSKL